MHLCLTFNDRSALGLIEGLRANGLHIPTDVSVLGYDDSQLARLSYVQLLVIRKNKRSSPGPVASKWDAALGLLN
jgi:DNA-binding LacI/PurR family transcriptional regulator